MKYIVSLNVQVVVEASTASVAERDAWKDRERLRKSKDACVTAAQVIRETT